MGDGQKRDHVGCLSGCERGGDVQSLPIAIWLGTFTVIVRSNRVLLGASSTAKETGPAAILSSRDFFIATN